MNQPVIPLASAARYWTLVNPIWDPYPVVLSNYWAHFWNWVCLFISSWTTWGIWRWTLLWDRDMLRSPHTSWSGWPCSYTVILLHNFSCLRKPRSTMTRRKDRHAEGRNYRHELARCRSVFDMGNGCEQLTFRTARRIFGMDTIRERERQCEREGERGRERETNKIPL